MQQVRLTLYSFKGRSNQWWAFTQMGLAPEALQKVEGLQFFKMMGTGAGEGFRPWPDTGTYALLTVWNSEDHRQQAYAEQQVFLHLAQRCTKSITYGLRPYRGHGLWHQQQPFELQHPPEEGERVAVITRARIKWRWMPYFWWRVRKVSRHLRSMPGLELAKGIGEWPLVEQATFSIWRQESDIDQYAYRGNRHREVVKATRITGWYAEEMFMRFAVEGEEVYSP
jgi:heme-degrading monooxygenase HmoA